MNECIDLYYNSEALNICRTTSLFDMSTQRRRILIILIVICTDNKTHTQYLSTDGTNMFPYRNRFI